MTDDANEPLELTDFATFEAEAGKEPEGDDAPKAGADDAPDDKAIDAATDKVDDPDGDDDAGDDPAPKHRSKPAKQRINELVAKGHEKDRLIAQLMAERDGKPAQQADPTAALAELEAKKPKADDFEFGEADSAYIDALTDWKLDVRDAKRDAKAAEDSKTNDASEQQRQIVDKLNTGLQSVEDRGKEKYDDFEDVLKAAAETRGEALHPLVGIAVVASPVGEEITYHLAKDAEATEKLDRLANTNVMGAALYFGELEGEYVGDDDSDLDLRDPLDQMRLNGRMKARMRGAGKKPTGKLATDAPTPAKHQARGSGGQFEAGADTSDFAAFERRTNGKR